MLKYTSFIIFAFICLLSADAISLRANTKPPKLTAQQKEEGFYITKSPRQTPYITQNQSISTSADAILLSCIDFRLIDDTVYFMNTEGLNNDYDEFILAGASLGYNQQVYPHWGKTFDDHLGLAVKLHNAHEVVVVDHENCGAYKKFYPDVNWTTISKEDEKNFHATNQKTFKDAILAQHPNFKFEGYYIHLDGTTELLSGSE